MKNLSLIIIGTSIAFLYSCTPIHYYPNGLTTPDIKKKGDIYVEAKISTIDGYDHIGKDERSNSISGTAGIGITNNHFAYFKYSNAKRDFQWSRTYSIFNRTTTSFVENEIKDFEMGFGYNHHFTEFSRFNVTLVSELGNSSGSRYTRGNESEKTVDYTKYFSPGLQFGFTFDNDCFLLSYQFKFGSLFHYDLHSSGPTSGSFVDLNEENNVAPYFYKDLKIGYGKKVRGFVQSGIYLPVDSHFTHPNGYVGAGVSMNLNVLGRS